MNLFAKAGKALMKFKPVAKTVAKVNKNKPEILAVSGGVLIVGAFVWAIYEAVGLGDTLNEASQTVKTVEDAYNAELEKENLSEEKRNDIQKEYKRELTKARFKGVMKVGKRFVLPTITLAVGMGCSTKGFKLLRGRNIVLATGLKGTQEAYKFYRENVKKDLGEEADKKYANGVVGEKEIEKIFQDEDGKEVKVKEKIPVVDSRINPLWRFEYSDIWFDSYKDDSDMNLSFLKMCQDYWDNVFGNDTGAGISMYDILKYLGFKFEVLRDGMSPKEFRRRIMFYRKWGWRGKGHIDFGLFKECNNPVRLRHSDIVWIEFNCMGPLDEI